MYAAGLGVPQDYEAAMLWYRKSAEQGNAAALFGLGGMYFEGRRVPRDYMQAYIWFSLAASQLDAEDATTPGQFRYEAAMARQSRNEAAAKLTPAQIAEAQKLAREWKPKRAQ
jgi:TPR repeat protein